jgi:sugar lactone lactonase YvrE
MRNTAASVACALLLLAGACDYEPAYIVTPPPVPAPVDSARESFPEGLWTISGTSGQIVRLDASQLSTDGVHAPVTRLFTSSANLISLNSVAFDSAGTMWVASVDDSRVLAFEPGEADASGFTTPAVILSPNSGSIAGPSGIAFDSHRNLWVANFTSGTIVRFDRSQLERSGAPVPAVIVSGIAHPTGLAFDAAGALWVTDIQANTVSRYLPDQLLNSGDQPPAVVLSAVAGSFTNPSGIAFDSFNNMWVANTGNESVVVLRPPQRAASGAPVPFTIRLASSNLANPSGLAFDQEGSLWVMGISGILSKFTAGSLAASGPAEAVLQIEIPDNGLFWSIAFWPRPSGFPLN